jgi:hypothetical protein
MQPGGTPSGGNPKSRFWLYCLGCSTLTHLLSRQVGVRGLALEFALDKTRPPEHDWPVAVPWTSA